EARHLTLRWRDLARLKASLPAILRLRDGSSMVLEGFRADGESGPMAILRDPTSAGDALVAVDETRLAAQWDGETILVKRRHLATDEERPFGFAWLFGRVLEEWRLFRDIGIASIIATVFAVIPPFMVMAVLDRVLIHRSLSTLTVIAV